MDSAIFFNNDVDHYMDPTVLFLIIEIWQWLVIMKHDVTSGHAFWRVEMSVGYANLQKVHVKILPKDPLAIILKDQESVWVLLLKPRNGRPGNVWLDCPD